MDIEQLVKRLAVMFAASLVIIFAAKFMLSKAITYAGKKQQAATVVQPAAPSAPAASAVEASPAASAVAPAANAPASAVGGAVAP